MPVIYADILLILNLAVDYLVLFGTARLGGLRFERLKGFFSAAIGAFYSLIILFPFPNSILVLSKLAISALMVLVAFRKRKPNEIIRILLIFYICSFIFSGFMMLLGSVFNSDSFFIKNGIVYFEFSAMEIVISGTAAFLVTEILRRLFRHGEPEDCSFAKIYHNGRCAVLKCFTDTGNSLSEPFSGTPVAVAKASSIAEILPGELFEELKTGNLSTGSNIRFIPAKTVSGTVLMPAFRPEKVEISGKNGEYEAEEIMIAVSEYAEENTLIIGKNLVLKEKRKSFTEV